MENAVFSYLKTVRLSTIVSMIFGVMLTIAIFEARISVWQKLHLISAGWIFLSALIYSISRQQFTLHLFQSGLIVLVYGGGLLFAISLTQSMIIQDRVATEYFSLGLLGMMCILPGLLILGSNMAVCIFLVATNKLTKTNRWMVVTTGYSVAVLVHWYLILAA